MPRLVAAIDQGTTSTRCILFDGAGLPVATAQKEHRQIYPRPGWVEHDPAEIWRRTHEVVAEAVQWLVERRPAQLNGRVVAAPATPTILETRLDRIREENRDVLRLR